MHDVQPKTRNEDNAQVKNKAKDGQHTNCRKRQLGRCKTAPIVVWDGPVPLLSSAAPPRCSHTSFLPRFWYTLNQLDVSDEMVVPWYLRAPAPSFIHRLQAEIGLKQRPRKNRRTSGRHHSDEEWVLVHGRSHTFHGAHAGRLGFSRAHRPPFLLRPQRHATVGARASLPAQMEAPRERTRCGRLGAAH